MTMTVHLSVQMHLIDIDKYPNISYFINKFCPVIFFISNFSHQLNIQTTTAAYLRRGIMLVR